MFAGQSANLFLYVQGDPVNGFDPTGLECSLSDLSDCIRELIPLVRSAKDLYNSGRELLRRAGTASAASDPVDRQLEKVEGDDFDPLAFAKAQQQQQRLTAGAYSQAPTVARDAIEFVGDLKDFIGAFCPLRQPSPPPGRLRPDVRRPSPRN